MQKTAFALLAILIALPAFSQDGEKEKKKDDRWKLTFSGSVVGPGEVWMDPRGTCVNCQDSFQVGLGRFTDDYMRRNGAIPRTVKFKIPRAAYGSHYSIPTVRLDFRTRYLNANSFYGDVGDEFLLRMQGTVNDVREAGVALGSSLEYRLRGGLWAAFSFNVSKDMIVSRSETAEFLRVEGIRPGTWRNLYFWDMTLSRHHLRRESEQRHRFYSFALLAKYDLTRSNDHWSIMPQVGAEVLLERRVEIDSTRFSQFTRFADDDSAFWNNGRGSGDLVQTRNTYWLDRVRPVAGVSIELYPGGKNGFVGITLDGRYRFNPDGDAVTYKHGHNYFPSSYELAGRPFVLPYEHRSGATDWTITLGGVVRF